jgi:cytidylate kinase
MSTHTYLDHGLTIFRTKLNPADPQSQPSLSSPVRPFLTISRETCAGATTLGRYLLPLLDEHLGHEDRSWMFLDKDLLTHALTTNHLPEHLASYLPEDRRDEIKGMIGEIVGLHPPLWELEQRVSEAILQVAQLGRVIFAGRGSHLVTRGLPGAFHIRLVASLPVRIRRMQELQNCDRAAAERILAETDGARRRYVQANFEQDINDPHTYDLVINTDRVRLESAAQLVIRAMADRFVAAAAPLRAR